MRRDHLVAVLILILAAAGAGVIWLVPRWFAGRPLVTPLSVALVAVTVGAAALLKVAQRR